MRGRASHRLEQLAAALEPERGPYYVRRPISPALEHTFPADGWYWVPRAHRVAVYLGASFEAAAVELRRQLTEQERDEESDRSE
jgi:hypothetical protein